MGRAAEELEEALEVCSPMLSAEPVEAASPAPSTAALCPQRPWTRRAAFAASLALASLGVLAVGRRPASRPQPATVGHEAPSGLFALPDLRLHLPHLAVPWHRAASASAPTSPAPPAVPRSAPVAGGGKPGPPAAAARSAASAGAEARAAEAVQGQCGAPATGSIHEYEHGILVDGNQSSEACCAKCLAVPACVSWSLLTEGVLRTGVPECWLKSGKRRRAWPKAGAVSGVVPSRLEPVAFGTPAYELNYQALHRPIGFACQAQILPELPEPNPGGGGPVELGVATWNLFWSTVFDQGRPGELHSYQATRGNAATERLAQLGQRLPPDSAQIDLMAFQECMDIGWLFDKAGLTSDFHFFQGSEELCIAVRKEGWSVLDRGQSSVAEDRPSLYWRKRDVQWLRLRHHATGAAVLFLNHHGPLPIDSGGVCGGPATAFNLLSLAAEQAFAGDVVVLVGDFNARAGSATIGQLRQRLHLVASGTKQGGIDNVFTNLGASSVSSAATLDGAGSDHDALGAVLLLGRTGQAAPGADSGAAWPRPF